MLWHQISYVMLANSKMSIKVIISKCHGISWNFLTFDFAQAVPWNSAEYSMEPCCHLKWCPPNSTEFHGTWWHLIWHRFCGTLGSFKWRPTSSMECHGTQLYLIKWTHSSTGLHGIFHGMIPWCHLKRRPTSSMEFHRIWWHLFRRRQSSVAFHGSLCDLKWHHPSSMEFHGTGVTFCMATQEFHGLL